MVRSKSIQEEVGELNDLIGGLEESSVELRLTSVGLPEIVALLEQIEATTEPVYVKRVELKRRYDDRARFDATIVTAALTRT